MPVDDPDKKSADPLDRMAPEEILSIAKTYFLMGLAFLPFMWLINFIHLHRVARRRKDELSPSVATYLYLSLGGCAVWTVLIFTWLGLYLSKRTQWGEFGDRISINLPLGS
ncbi:hypothetical protein HDU78_004747 [Chytriomyces hyalinus]|nr:hypothetical protein HDU78_004747 [Chytriomyces hyalinus]KAJ3263826.1 hypothetical protein HDU77_009850 [Chytriomyces hyalinus]